MEEGGRGKGGEATMAIFYDHGRESHSPVTPAEWTLPSWTCKIAQESVQEHDERRGRPGRNPCSVPHAADTRAYPWSMRGLLLWVALAPQCCELGHFLLTKTCPPPQPQLLRPLGHHRSSTGLAFSPSLSRSTLATSTPSTRLAILPPHQKLSPKRQATAHHHMPRKKRSRFYVLFLRPRHGVPSAGQSYRERHRAGRRSTG